MASLLNVQANFITSNKVFSTSVEVNSSAQDMEGIIDRKQAKTGLEENKYQPESKSREGDARWSYRGIGAQ